MLASLFSTKVAIADDTDMVQFTDVVDEYVDIVRNDLHRSYDCRDINSFATSNKPYIFIRISRQTNEVDGARRKIGFVQIGDATYVSGSHQSGLDYRVDFWDWGGGDGDGDGNYSIVIQNDGSSSFYDFSDTAEGEKQTSERSLVCEKVRSGDSLPADFGDLDEYIGQIRQKIQRNWSVPASAGPDLSCLVSVRQARGGEVRDVTILSCNGDDAVRRSIEAAIYRSSPLPEPSDPSLFSSDLELNLRTGQ